LLDNAYEAPISKQQNGTPKVARRAFNIGVVWNPVCCHGNKAAELRSNRKQSDIWYKLVAISFLVPFVYFKNLNISETKRDI